MDLSENLIIGSFLYELMKPGAFLFIIIPGIILLFSLRFPAGKVREVIRGILVGLIIFRLCFVVPSYLLFLGFGYIAAFIFPLIVLIISYLIAKKTYKNQPVFTKILMVTTLISTLYATAETVQFLLYY